MTKHLLLIGSIFLAAVVSLAGEAPHDHASCPMHGQTSAANEAKPSCPMHGQQKAAKGEMANCPMHSEHEANGAKSSGPMHDQHDAAKGEMQSCPMHDQHAAANGEMGSPAMHEQHPAKGGMASCPMHADSTTADASAAHGAEVDHRHDAFGMMHEATHHSFRLFPDGGAIELRANAASDTATIEMIRAHLETIAGEFSRGDFHNPMFVHGKAPSGVEAMQRLASSISYRYESLPEGGRVRIATNNTEALAAIHEFLRFQIVEHRTGDTAKVETAH
jgi:hypothetical protein